MDRPVSVLGAPLLNARNEILGFVADDQPSVEISPAPQISMTILPISQVRTSAEKIIKAGGDIQSGWLGVMVDTEVVSKDGVVISDVEADGPAHKAGLLPGDIIAKWEGKRIRDQLGLIELVENTPIGARAVIDVLRKGQPVRLTAVIEARKPVDPYREWDLSSMGNLAALPGAQISARGVPADPALGIYLLPLTPQLAEVLQMRVHVGLFVASVTPHSAFESAGIAVGDVIVDIDGAGVENPQTFFERVKSKAAGSRIMLRLLRKGTELTKNVVLPGSSGKRRN
jgi:serine protease Do